MTVAAVKRRGRHTLVVNAGVERQLGNFLAAFSANPHHTVFWTKHGSRAATKSLRIIPLKHYAKLANPYYFYEIYSEITCTRKPFVKK